MPQEGKYENEWQMKNTHQSNVTCNRWNFTQMYFHKFTKQWNNWFCLQKQSRICKSSGKQEKEIEEERPQDEKPEEWLQIALLHNECVTLKFRLKLNAQHDDTPSQGLQEVTRD